MGKRRFFGGNTFFLNLKICPNTWVGLRRVVNNFGREIFDIEVVGLFLELRDRWDLLNSYYIIIDYRITIIINTIDI